MRRARSEEQTCALPIFVSESRPIGLCFRVRDERAEREKKSNDSHHDYSNIESPMKFCVYSFGPMPIKKPSPAAVLIALVPFLAMCFSVGLWDRVEPTVHGIPFSLLWLVSWMILSSLFLSVAYRLEKRRDKKDSEE